MSDVIGLIFLTDHSGCCVKMKLEGGKEETVVISKFPRELVEATSFGRKYLFGET